MFIKPHLIKEYFFCKYILFYYKNNYKFNQDNYHLIEGKFLEKDINNNISFIFFKIDEIDNKNKIIYERKKSFSNKEGSKYQLLYYLYLTRNIFKNYFGILETYNKKYSEKVELNEDNIKLLLKILKDIEEIFINIDRNFLPEKHMSVKCEQCSFNDYCLI